MGKAFYDCDGCTVKVSEKDYANGHTTCEVDSCPNKGKPLVFRNYCSKCDIAYGKGEEHICVEKHLK